MGPIRAGSVEFVTLLKKSTMRPKAVITGATKGIGRAVAFKLMQEGYDIAVCSRSQKDLEGLKQELQTLYPGPEVWIRICDVSQPEQVKAWCGELSAHWQMLEILVNNAGLFYPGSVLTEPDEALPHQLGVNLYSAYHFTRCLMPLIRRNGRGHIFNLCSIASKTVYGNGGAYTISKFAVYGFSQCLREELKPTDVKVTAVLPGATWSDSWKDSGHDPEEMIHAEDIAELIWTCSRLSKVAVVEELVIRPQGGDL